MINNSESHAGAGPSGTNAPSSSTTWGVEDWLNSAWATPGEKIRYGLHTQVVKVSSLPKSSLLVTSHRSNLQPIGSNCTMMEQMTST